MQLPHPGPRAFLRATQAVLALVAANIVSGAAVRLTDSGLGCPDWPTCSKQSLTPPLSLHPVMEFGNRMVVVALVVVTVAVLLAAVVRRPWRRDLVWLSGGLAGGVVAEAVLGGIVVYTKLNPYAVMAHFAVGIGLLSVSTVLTLRAGRAAGAGQPRVTLLSRQLAGAVVAVLAVAVVAGTATTGAGPHAGGKGAVRLPVPLADMARTHSGIVLVLGALVLVELAVLLGAGAPAAVAERGQLLLVAMIGQGVVGYTQYFSHLPPLLVGVHVAGACAVWCAALWFVDGLYDHAPETTPADGPREPQVRDETAASAVPS